MGAQQPCPATKLLLSAIEAESPEDHKIALNLVQAHMSFCFNLARTHGSNQAIAQKRSEEALGWALMDLYNVIIRREKE